MGNVTPAPRIDEGELNDRLAGIEARIEHITEMLIEFLRKEVDGSLVACVRCGTVGWEGDDGTYLEWRWSDEDDGDVCPRCVMNAEACDRQLKASVGAPNG